mmetsp:Transcript_20052/g.44761  ORF Transcript_20052/g.44761 Transcript_20052/m.44761 type:complete len:155 (-) Transcript_20052:50-514(-)
MQTGLPVALPTRKGSTYCSAEYSGHVAQHAGKFKQTSTLVFRDSVVRAHKVHGFFVAHHVRGHRIRSFLIRGIGFQTFKEERDVDFERVSDIPQPRSAYTVCAGFVFLDLLELDPDTFGKLLLGHTHQPPALANALSDMDVYKMCHHISLLDPG